MVVATVANFQVAVEAVNSSSCYSRLIQDIDETYSLRDRFGYCNVVVVVDIDHSHLR